MKAHTETNTALKVVTEIDGKYFVQLDGSIARFLHIKHGHILQQKLTKEGVLLEPYEQEEDP